MVVLSIGIFGAALRGLQKFSDNLLIPIFILRGMKPWKFGYSSYKRRQIKKYVSQSTFSLDTLPSGYGYRIDERIIEYPWLFSRLLDKPERILDAGSVLNYEYLVGNG